MWSISNCTFGISPSFSLLRFVFQHSGFYSNFVLYQLRRTEWWHYLLQVKRYVSKYFQNFDNQLKKYKNALTQKTHIHVYIPVWVLIKYTLSELAIFIASYSYIALFITHLCKAIKTCSHIVLHLQWHFLYKTSLYIYFLFLSIVWIKETHNTHFCVGQDVSDRCKCVPLSMKTNENRERKRVARNCCPILSGTLPLA